MNWSEKRSFDLTAPTQRTAWIDVLKGIAIFFVVLGHHPYVAQLPTKVFNIIFSFHVPLLFFISGYLFNPNIAWASLFRKRFNSLLRPYLFTVVVVSLSYVLVKGDGSFSRYLFWTIYANGPNLPKSLLHLWYLPNLFLVTMLVWIPFRYLHKINYVVSLQFWLIIICLIAGVSVISLCWNLKVPIYMTNYFGTDGNLLLINGLLDNPTYSKEALLQDGRFVINGLPWGADFVLISAAFFMSGYFVKKNNLEKIFREGSLAIIMLLLFATLHYIYNYTIDLNLRRYDNLVISSSLAFAAIYVCVYSSYAIANANAKIGGIFAHIGSYSLIVYILHPSIQSKAFLAMSALLPRESHFVAIVVAFLAGICVPLLLNWLVFRRYRFLRYWYYANARKAG